MKLVKSLLATLIVVIFAIVGQTMQNDMLVEGTNEEEINMIDSVIFPHDEVVEVNIDIATEDYDHMVNNALDEEYYIADMTYNGRVFNNVAIRTKGNSSLRDVFNSGGNRFSFKIDINYYIGIQNFYGITKLNFNNLYMDPTMMAEYITYELFDELDTVASKTTYIALSINGEYYGLYLSVEQVNIEFLEENYGEADGLLYKPEMGRGSDLAYRGEDVDLYTGLYSDNSDDYSKESIVNLIKEIDTFGDIEEIFNVDSFLKYLAISTYVVHLDSYQGTMYHNYYLYEDNSVFQWIPWDLNMTFNGFPGSFLNDSEATEFLIDEPVMGLFSDYPIVEAILSNPEHLETYHGYLEELINGYFSEDNFNERVLEIYEMIDNYVKTDPSSFYSYDEFVDHLFEEDTASSILGFVDARNENITLQLSGAIDSTNNGFGNKVGSALGDVFPPGWHPPSGGQPPPNTEPPPLDPPDQIIPLDIVYVSIAGVLMISAIIFLSKQKLL